MQATLKKRARKQPESLIAKSIMEFLALKGVFCWQNKTQGTFDPKRKIYRANTTKKGVSDILGVLKCGKFLAIEVKTKTGSLSEHQKVFLEDINRHFGVGFVARSIEEVDLELKKRLEYWN